MPGPKNYHNRVLFAALVSIYLCDVLNLQLDIKLAALLHQHSVEQVPVKNQKTFSTFFRYLQQHNLSPVPVFPGTADENLIIHFSLPVAQQQIQQVQTDLLKIKGVNGA
jgi:hypothetical protein